MYFTFGILDWEVESEFGREEVAEDAAVVAAREKKRVWSRRAIIVAAILLRKQRQRPCILVMVHDIAPQEEVLLATTPGYKLK